MNIGLIDIDSHNFPNLALMKLSAYHKSCGDSVEWWYGHKHYDIVYKSRIFDDVYSEDYITIIDADRVVLGGTGYGLDNKLDEIVEHQYPDYDIYPEYFYPKFKSTAYGFLTRGCPRNCKFCIVSEKEGLRSNRVADLSEFWKGQKLIKLLDPNILACKEHEQLLQQLISSGAQVDFTQGLDIRFVNSDNISLLNQIKIKRLHFAWDNQDEDLTEHFRRFLKYTKVRSYSKRKVYVLTNFNSTLDQDLYRIYALRDMGYDPYVMVYNKPEAPRIIKDLQRWVNSKWIFNSVKDFKDYNNPEGIGTRT